MPPALTESATALPSVKDWPSGGVLMDGMDGAADTMSVCGTLLAGKYVASPPWLAVMVVLPTPMMVTVLPLTVATEVTELLKLTGNPLLAMTEQFGIRRRGEEELAHQFSDLRPVPKPLSSGQDRGLA